MKYNNSYYYNEIELIRVQNPELKNKIEKLFLRNRISYFIRWDRVSFWQRLTGKTKKEQCKICINEWDKDIALELLKGMEGTMAGQGEILLKKTESALKDTYI